MSPPVTTARAWTRRVFRRGGWLRTIGILVLAGVLLLGAAFATRSLWTPAFGRSLVCDETPDSRTDAILIDNLDAEYLLFERAAELHARHDGPRIYVLVNGSYDGAESLVEEGIVELMARVAGIPAWSAIAFDDTEPISLNVAFRIRERLRRDQLSSVTIVTPGFRSRRASLIYDSVLREGGISTTCVPVFGPVTPGTWTKTTHGIQEVGLQFGKLLYYRTWILPFMSRR